MSSDESPYKSPAYVPPPGGHPPAPYGPVNRDLEHLRILSIFYYVFGGLSFFGSCFFLIYMAIGVMLLVMPTGPNQGGGPPPQAIGWAFIIGSSIFVLVGWTIAFCIIMTGRFLAGQRRFIFCTVIAVLICLSIPLGTILGVFTLVVLFRPSVKLLFDASRFGDQGYTGRSPFAEPPGPG